MSLRQRLFRLYTEWVTPASGAIPFIRMKRPLSDLTVALVTTAGVRLSDQASFAVDTGDPTYRVIPADADLSRLIPDHTHYDTEPARSDLDCVFPLKTLRALVEQGMVGGLSPVHFGLMGYIPDLEPLVNQSIPALVERLKAAQVGAVLLSPG